MKKALMLLGPPGCGKTHRLIEEVRQAVLSGIPPQRIGYVSFTRKAVEEAMQRAGADLGLTKVSMPYFKTLHALGFHLTGMHRSSVMDAGDWRTLSEHLGIDIEGVSHDQASKGLLLPVGMGGNRYVAMIDRAQMRCISLEQEFAETADYGLSWEYLLRFRDALKAYCRDTGKHTFVDMLRVYVEMGEVPELDLLIVDEAQDLVPLQWEMVGKLMTRAKRTIFAGDDDQAIHRWAGVDVRRFVAHAQHCEVLGQSFRMPQTVHALSQELVRRIPNRILKPFAPTDRRGSVSEVLGRQSVDISNGSWTLMVRTNSFVSEWAKQLRADGVFFEAFGKSSVDADTAKAILSWRELQTGAQVDLHRIKQLYDQLPKQGDGAAVKRGSARLFEAEDPLSKMTMAQLRAGFGLLVGPEVAATEALRLGEQESEYVLSLERRGVDISARPRVKVSTFHAMKGGEDDNVAVFLGTTRSCTKSPYPEDETRAFYVGVTRARENLVIVQSDKKQRFFL